MTQQIAWPPSGGIHIHLNLAPPTMPVPAPAQADDAPLQRMHDRLLAQIVRINDWCAEHAPDEYHYDGNTADAIIAAADRLRGQVARLELMLAAADAAAYAAAEASTTSRHELATAIAERDEADGLLAKLADWLADKPVVGDGDVVMSAITLMESQAAEIKRLNADLALLRSYAIATPHGNGKSAAALDRLPPTDLPEQYPPAIVAAVEAAQAATVQPVEAALVVGDDPELSDYIIGLDAGHHHIHGGTTMTQQIAWPPSGGIHIHLNLAPPEPAPKSAVPVIDQLRVKAIDGQLQRLNRWLAEHSRQDYEDSFSDTADAMIAAADRLRGQVARLSDPGALVERDKLRIELATAIAERDASDSLLAKLADWLADKPVVGDGDVVMSAITLMESQAAEIKRLNADLALLRSYAIATPHGNGKSAAALDRLPPTDLPEQYPPAIVAAVEAAQAATVQPVEAALVVGDDPELSDYIIGLEAGRHTWRTIPKLVRWRLVQAHLRSIWRDGKLPTMADYDANRPAWMPIATSIAMTFGDGKWTVVCGKAIEP